MNDELLEITKNKCDKNKNFKCVKLEYIKYQRTEIGNIKDGRNR